MREKNIIIGGLLAVVCVMAIGYAAFATNLKINTTAKIGSGSTSTAYWDVHFDTSKTSTVAATTGLTGATAPTGTISYPDNLTANITANLKQPGDKLVFTFTILNKGKLKAKAGTPVLSGTGVSGLTATNGNIKFTVTAPSPTSLAATTGTATMTVTAEFTNPTANTVVNEQSASLTVTIPYTQDTSA